VNPFCGYFYFLSILRVDTHGLKSVAQGSTGGYMGKNGKVGNGGIVIIGTGNVGKGKSLVGTGEGRLPRTSVGEAVGVGE
jgi:hypothetical protein